MSKVKIQGNASGTGVLTVTAPNTSTDRTITLPDEDVTLGAATPSIDDNGDATAITINSSEQVGIGTSSPDSSLEIYKASTAELMIGSDNGGTAQISLYESNSTTKEATIKYDGLANNLVIGTSGEANAIVIPRDSGNVGVGTSSPNNPVHINGGASDTALQITNNATGTTSTDGFSITVENPSPDVVIRNRESTNMRFLTANTERMRILSSGGITFNGDTSSDNALSDYEEGTFTPAFIGGTTAGSYTLSTPLGSYTKIGNLVHIRLTMWNITTASAGSGNIRITGLPYTVATYDSRGSIGTLELDNFNFSGSINATAEENSTYIQLRNSRTGTSDYLMQVGDKTNNIADLAINLTYRVA